MNIDLLKANNDFFKFKIVMETSDYLSQAEISRKFGCSRAYICKILKENRIPEKFIFKHNGKVKIKKDFVSYWKNNKGSQRSKEAERSARRREIIKKFLERKNKQD
jgi:hypothetical protein